MPIVAAAGSALFGSAAATAATIGTAASIGASVYGAKKQSDAAKSAANTMANAQQQATDAQVQAQREALAAQKENLAYLRSVYQPEIAATLPAQAKLDALTNGTGSTGAYLPRPQAASTGYMPASASAPSAARLYLDQNPDVAAEAQRVGWDPETYATWHFETYGRNEGRQSPDALLSSYVQTDAAPQAAPDPGQAYTRDDVMSEIAQNPLYQMGEAEYGDASALDTEQLGGDLSRAGAFRDETLNRIAAEQARREAEIAAARSQREGALTGYINAWDAQAQAARGRAEDQLFSRGGVTGMIGQTRRGVAQVGEDYARDRATTEAKGRQDILESYLGDSADLGGWTYDSRNQAYTGYYGDQGNAYANSYARRNANMGNRYAQRRAGYANQVGLYQDAANRRERYLGAMTGAQTNYANQQSQAFQNIGNTQAQGYINTGNTAANAGLVSASAWKDGLSGAAGAIGDYWAQRGGFNGQVSRSRSKAQDIIRNNPDVF